MAWTCMFCSNSANSKEHIWPQWIHERKDFGPLNFTHGNKPTVAIPNPRVTGRAVCKKCNEGWMSLKLEVPTIPLVGNMMQGLTIVLHRDQQQTVAQWCVKMAFLSDWGRIEGRSKRFYTRDEALAFAADLTIPPRTRIWIGHLTTSHLMRDGHDFELLHGPTQVGLASVVTLVVGHFVAQILTDHIQPEHANLNSDFASRPGPWEAKLFQIWPIEKEWITWPPRASFTNGGPEGIGYLLQRWRIGKRINQLI